MRPPLFSDGVQSGRVAYSVVEACFNEAAAVQRRSLNHAESCMLSDEEASMRPPLFSDGVSRVSGLPVTTEQALQ